MWSWSWEVGYFLYLRGERVEERGSESKSSGDFGVEIDGVCTTVIYSSILLDNPSKKGRLIPLINLCRKSFSFVHSLYL